MGARAWVEEWTAASSTATSTRCWSGERHGRVQRPQRKPRAPADGCEALGYELGPTVRNTDRASYDPGTAGFIGFGDASGSKRSTAKTYLADAQLRGADLVAHCRAQRILVEDGRAAGVEAAYADPEGHGVVTVRAPQVVVACGSIESPALLLRSGIGGPAVGDYLRLHPTTAVSGHYEDDQRPWWGPPQAAISHTSSPTSRTGTGSCSSAPIHHGAGGGGRGVGVGRQAQGVHARVAADGVVHQPDAGPRPWPRRDRRGGERGRGSTRWPTSSTCATSAAGSTRWWSYEAAGARRIVALARKPTYWERGQDLDAFADEVGRLSLAPREHAIFSAHQMGSCRMGVDLTTVAGPWGELHDVKACGSGTRARSRPRRG